MIDAKTIVDAFHRTGVKPVKGEFFNLSNNAACAIGVLCLENHQELNTGIRRWCMREFKVSYSFTVGVSDAFDGRPPINEYLKKDTDYMQGYVVGKKVNEIMFKECQ